MVRFEWDEAKAASNLRKHGVRFDDAMLVFGDAFAVMEQDRVEGGEVRWQTLGWPGGNLLLLVAHTVRNEGEDEIIRIISARKATRKERKRYDENRAKEFPH
ncbi:MAG: BrnT family toxin [Candidatus Acidiferrum sp.]